MESITAYFLRIEPDDIKRQARFKELAERFYFVMACDTTYDIRPELRDAGGEWVSYDDDPPANPLRTIVIRQSDGRATDSPYGLLEDIWTHCRKVILGFCEPDWAGLLRHAYITEQFAREWEQAAREGERGPVADNEPAAAPRKAQDAGAGSWKATAQAIASEYIAKHRRQDLFPSQDDVCNHVEEIMRKRKIYSDHDKPLSAKYIQRNAIQGDWWKANKP